MQIKRKNILATAMLTAGVALSFAVFPSMDQAANLTNTSVTLSNPRLSFVGELDANNTAGSSVVTIDTGTTQPSDNTNQLQDGDSVAIGESGSLGTYTVDSTTPPGQFTITAGLASGDADSGDAVIATQSATHTVRFTTVSAINDGTFRILVPSVANDTDAADGIPDGDAYDFTTSAPTVICPTDLTGYTFGAATANASSITIDGQDYHAFECPYTGSGAVGTQFDGTNEDAITIDSLINPAPESGHTAGTADTDELIIQHLDSSNTVVDQTSTAVGVIEAVKVTATVAPQITFTISGVSSSTTKCGVTTDVTTTATAVPFGDVLISSFRNAAQNLLVSTNAINGYTVTAVANDQMGLNGDTCTGDSTTNDCIQDAPGDNTAMSHTAVDEWNNTATKGFAFSLQNNDANSVPFEYSTSTGNCTGTFCARQFADAEDSQDPQQLFSSTTVADNEDVDVCYRNIVRSTTAAGDYSNFITFNATATF